MADVAGGDRGAFEELYRGAMPEVRRVALGVLRQPCLAEEVAQEVLLESWRRADRYDPEALRRAVLGRHPGRCRGRDTGADRSVVYLSGRYVVVINLTRTVSTGTGSSLRVSGKDGAFTRRLGVQAVTVAIANLRAA